MTRIIAGTHGGRRLVVPSGTTTRPTSGRAREGLFSTLQSLIDLAGTRVLDLYAGSGALGLEALSRGAATATLVESDPQALIALRTNTAALDLPAIVVGAEASSFLSGPPQPCDVVLLDPPYDVEIDPVLVALTPWLASGAIVVAERRTRSPEPSAPPGLEPLRARRYGEATLWYFRRT